VDFPMMRLDGEDATSRTEVGQPVSQASNGDGGCRGLKGCGAGNMSRRWAARSPAITGCGSEGGGSIARGLWNCEPHYRSWGRWVVGRWWIGGVVAGGKRKEERR